MQKEIPLEFLVIDEAAQLKECESAIPLQLPGLRHAILIGDERQLPAMVKSEVQSFILGSLVFANYEHLPLCLTCV
jgi:superfamily I DNA and/or RNA helicase